MKIKKKYIFLLIIVISFIFLSTPYRIEGLVNSVPEWSKCTTSNNTPPANPDRPYPKPGSSELWCGGDSYPINQITCSPFNYRPRMFYHTNNCGIDNNSFYDTIMSNSASQEDLNKKCDWISSPPNGRGGARVWGHFNLNGKLSKEGYFVFHGCDSAGIQPDCMGDIKYIERFERNIGTGVKSIEDYPNGPSCSTYSNNGIVDKRCYYTFVHPGTNIQYSNYAGGWWFNGKISEDAFNSHATGNWSSFTYEMFQKKFKRFINEYSKKENNFSFMLYPWTCVQTNEFGNNNSFSYPHINDIGYKCYVDNEPGNPGLGRPLFIEFYFGYISYSKIFKRWRITYTCVTMDKNLRLRVKLKKHLFPLCTSDNWKG